MALLGLLLDLDDTLVDDRGATRAAFRAFLTYHGVGRGSNESELLDRWREIMARQWERYERGELTFHEQRRERAREFLGKPLGDAAADEAMRPYFDAYQRSWALLPDVAVFLARTLHVPKVVVTNGERSQQLRKLAATGIGTHFAGVFAPGDCGFPKPHPEIFRAAARLIGVPVERCVMIGDDPARDIEPARALGMRAHRVEHGNPAAGILAALDGG
ncbi:MAG TPA: HAD family hydrolase [Gammaproteobacteria bacterium]|nr:HAD family hydrolase [Gammaproteobacteria bacterium]